MMKKRLALIISMLLCTSLALVSCAGVQTKPTEANFKAPSVKLDSIQIEYYSGFWTYGNAPVERGTAPRATPGVGGSSSITLSFVFDITNPNDFPVRFDSGSFFIFFEDYELRAVIDNNAMWIPAGMTNSKVLPVTIDALTTWAKFSLAGKQMAMQRKDDPWKKVEEWFTKLPEMSFPIDLKDGQFAFSANGLTRAVPLKIRYP
jgi:hypothetical protein